MCSSIFQATEYFYCFILLAHFVALEYEIYERIDNR